MGGYRVQGKSMEAARELIEDALAVERAGAFAIVLEGIPAEISRIITDRLSIPTIGIGAGPACDGQILVFNDLVGLTFGHEPRFVRQYANLRNVVSDALRRYADDVTAGRYPSADESYHLPEGVDINIGDDDSQSMPPLGPIH
jgi:3-methyl-2-oxobutanoate hydroxymethyltransferase